MDKYFLLGLSYILKEDIFDREQQLECVKIKIDDVDRSLDPTAVSFLDENKSEKIDLDCSISTIRSGDKSLFLSMENERLFSEKKPRLSSFHNEKPSKTERVSSNLKFSIINRNPHLID